MNVRKALISILALLICTFCPALAAGSEDKFSNSLSVSPLTQTVRLKAGNVYQGEIEASNSALSDHELSYFVEVMPFSFADEFGGVDLGTISDRTQIKDWVRLEKTEGTIPINSTVKIPYTIIVPEGAPSGGQYCAIAVSTYDEETPDDQIVSNVLEIATIIYATVEGNTDASGSIIRNYIPFISFRSPFQTGITLENTGNVHLTANVKVEVENIFDKEAEYPETNFSEVLLPGTKRVKNFAIDNLHWIGVFNVTQTVHYNGEEDVCSRLVFVIPLWLCLVILLTISFFTIWLIISLKKRIETRRYISRANGNFSLHKKHKM